MTQILVNTSAYIEPTLHLTIKYPDNQLFLYTYSDTYPKVTNLPKIPRGFCQHYEEDYLSKLIKENFSYMEYSTPKYKKDENKDLINLEIIDTQVVQNVKKFEPITEESFDKQLKTYLDTKEYLCQVNNKHLIEEIKHHTVQERQMTIESIRKQLKQHIKNIYTPIYEGEIKTETGEEIENKNNDYRNSDIVTRTCLKTNRQTEFKDHNRVVSPRKVDNLGSRSKGKGKQYSVFF